MFSNCNLLTTAPVLPATSLVKECYNKMFTGCAKLDYLKVLFTQWNEGSTEQWLDNVSLIGFLDAPCELPDIRDENHIPDKWNIKQQMMVLYDTIDPTATIMRNQEYCTNDIQICRTFLRNGNFNTISLPFDIDSVMLHDRTNPLYGAKVYELYDIVKKFEQIDLIVSEVKTLLAGYPYFIRWNNVGDTIVNPIFHDVNFSIEFSDTYYKNAWDTSAVMYGTLSPISTPSNEMILHLDGGEDAIWAYQNPDISLKGFRAYIVYDSPFPSQDKPIKFYNIKDYKYEEKPRTAIVEHSKESEDDVVKILQDGYLFIMKNGVKYSVLGQEVSMP